MDEANCACSCMRVEYTPVDCGGGKMREKWACQDFGTPFIKEIFAIRLREENERWIKIADRAHCREEDELIKGAELKARIVELEGAIESAIELMKKHTSDADEEAYQVLSSAMEGK